MNRSELGNRISDFVLGKKVEGTVVAVLPSSRADSSRYVIDTGDELVDVHVPLIKNHGLVISHASYTYNPPLNRSDYLNARATSVKAWIDGQQV